MGTFVMKRIIVRIVARRLLLATCLVLPHVHSVLVAARDSIDLSGEWQLALEPGGTAPKDADRRGNGAPGTGAANVDAKSRSHQPWPTAAYDRTAQLPGSLDVQGIGDPLDWETPWIGDWERSGYRDSARYAPYRPPHAMQLPFWLTPATHYVGPAWYRRTVTIPAGWRDQRVVLHLERCHWSVGVWIDGEHVGQGESLSAPQVFDLTRHASPGEHEVVLRIDNRMLLNVGPNSHSVSDHTQGNWNGAVGRIELHATPRIWVDHCRLDADYENHTIRATVTMGNLSDASVSGLVQVSIKPRYDAAAPATRAECEYTVPTGGGEVAVTCALGPGARTWDEHGPHLYDVTAIWERNGGAASDRATTSFGLRKVSVAGTRVTLNGVPRFLRGTLDCCVYPLTGHPPMDAAGWRRVLRVCQAHGLNHIRFHSWCPPEAAFAAADELGFYFQIECPSWANQGTELGAGKPIDDYLYREAHRILDAYGNHPSFVLFAYGNEPTGKSQSEYLTKWIEHFRGVDNRRLYTGGSGWPMIDANQFHVTAQPRIQQWGDGLKSRINAKPPETQSDYRDFIVRWKTPVIAHEIGQWCVYPNFEEIEKYTGHLKSKNFEIFRDFLEAADLGDQAEQFLMASGKLQTLCYKEDIESALRTPGFGGFQLLGLSDFSGQGTALVGPRDAFWDAKPYVKAEQYRHFTGPVVPLARLPRRTFTAGEAVAAQIDLANFGPRNLNPATAHWKLIDDASGAVVASGELAAAAVTGKVTRLGELQAELPSDAPAAKLRLIVAIADADAENEWDLWVYPVEQDPGVGDVLVTDTVNDVARQRLAGGGCVLLTVPAEQVKTDQVLGFSSIFWNTAWTERQPPHTLGVLCDPEHPALAEFPTEYHSNWQWWELINGAAALDLTQAKLRLDPVVQIVPDWFDPHLLALAIECRVGSGRLLVTSANVTTDQANRPAARQFKASLLAYMNSTDFDPQVALTLDQVLRLLR
jgi:hypothetical protein